MKAFAIAALLAGCASITPGDRSGKLNQIQQRSQAIAAQERACKDNVEKRTNDELARIKSSRDDFTESRTLSEEEQRRRQLAKCRADAQRAADELASDELASKDRAEYGSQAQEDRDRSTLMMMLITSRPH